MLRIKNNNLITLPLSEIDWNVDSASNFTFIVSVHCPSTVEYILVLFCSYCHSLLAYAARSSFSKVSAMVESEIPNCLLGMTNVASLRSRMALWVSCGSLHVRPAYPAIFLVVSVNNYDWLLTPAL